METIGSKRKQNILQDYWSDMIHPRSLNDFPQDIITHILKFLPTVYAIRTSILSRQWQTRKLWRSLPSLDFHFPFDRISNCTRIAEFIDKTLENRSGFPIQKFSFRLDSFWCDQWDWQDDICHRIESKLVEWIAYAISHKATELDIHLSNTYRYKLNFDLLNNSCVRDVKLYGGDLCHSLPSLNLGSIRSVCFNSITLTDDMLVDLISWCNNLESLVIKYCSVMKSLRICSSTLKKLSLEGSEGSSLEISCPNICSLSISNVEMDKYCIKDSASLVQADIRFSNSILKRSHVLKCWNEVVRLLTNVKQLTIQNYWFQLLCEKDASYDGFVFENLNYLKLETRYELRDLLGVTALLKICPKITTLTLDCYVLFNEHVMDVDKPIEFNIPNLKILNLRNSQDKVKEKLVRLMKKHRVGAALEKIVVRNMYNKTSISYLQ